MHKQNSKSWFTLVELIVVITILAILGAIAFVSFQWYSKSARDWQRISDITLIEKSLEFFRINSWKFPEPVNWYNVTFSWELVWTQWVFWEINLSNVRWLNKLPVDPLTSNYYVYSLLNTKNEYSLWSIIEWSKPLSINIIPNTYAASSNFRLYVKWNYNWIVARINKWDIVYVLAVPSIIASTWSTLEYIIQNNKLAFNDFNNLPFNYDTWNNDEINWSENLKLTNFENLIVYTWSVSNLISESDDTYRQNMILKIKQAYNGSEIANYDSYKDIVNLDNLSAKKVCQLWRMLTNNNFWSKLSLDQEKNCLQEWELELPELPEVPTDPINIVFENDNWTYTCELCD